MASRFNKGFSLLEVLITVGILSSAVVFLFRSFATSLSAARFSQNIQLACNLAENKLWEIEARQRESLEPLAAEAQTEELQGRKFNWSDESAKLEGLDLIKLNFKIAWPQKAREQEYSLEFFTYLLPKKK